MYELILYNILQWIELNWIETFKWHLESKNIFFPK